MSTKVNVLKLSSGNADASGAATYSSNPIYGNIQAIHIEYDSGSSANTDVVITDDRNQTILSKSNSNTDGVYYPRRAQEDYQGTSLLYAAGGQIVPCKFSVYGPITITIADQTEGKGVTASILYEQ